MVRNEQPFEFDTLDELWSRAEHLKPNECLEVRHRTQGKEGPMQEIKKDQRFKDFKTWDADYRTENQVDDLHCFRIRRNPVSPRQPSQS